MSSVLEMRHALLNTSPVNNGPGLQDVQLASETPPLLLEADDGGLAEDDAVDGAYGRGHSGSNGVTIAACPGRGRGRAAEGGAEGGWREAGGNSVEPGGLHLDGKCWAGSEGDDGGNL